MTYKKYAEGLDEVDPVDPKPRPKNLVDDLDKLKTAQNWHGLEFKTQQDDRVFVNITHTPGDESPEEYLRTFLEGMINFKLARDPDSFARDGYSNFSDVEKFDDIRKEELTDFSFRVVSKAPEPKYHAPGLGQPSLGGNMPD